MSAAWGEPANLSLDDRLIVEATVANIDDEQRAPVAKIHRDGIDRATTRRDEMGRALLGLERAVAMRRYALELLTDGLIRQ